MAKIVFRKCDPSSLQGLTLFPIYLLVKDDDHKSERRLSKMNLVHSLKYLRDNFVGFFCKDKLAHLKEKFLDENILESYLWPKKVTVISDEK